MKQILDTETCLEHSRKKTIGAQEEEELSTSKGNNKMNNKNKKSWEYMSKLKILKKYDVPEKMLNASLA